LCWSSIGIGMEAAEKYKLIMTWDLAPTREREYFEFVVRVFLPALQRMGLDINEAWATAYGDQPQIQVGAVMPDLHRLQQTLRSQEWTDLHDQLSDFIIHYQQKIVRARDHFQF